MKQYLLGDALIRIKNAQERKFKSVIIPTSKLIKNVLQILKQEYRIWDYKIFDTDTKKEIQELKEAKKAEIHVFLRYFIDKKYTIDTIPVIRKVKFFSKPSCRVYKNREELNKLVRYLNMELYIVSTSAGLCVLKKNSTNSASIADNLGGELLCRIS